MTPAPEYSEPFDTSQTAWEGGEAVPVQTPTDSRLEVIVDWLIERGVDLHVADSIAQSFDDLLDAIDESRNTASEAETVRNVFRFLAARLKGTGLDKTPSGRALRRVLERETCDRSLAADATATGSSKQLISYHEKQLARRLLI